MPRSSNGTFSFANALRAVAGTVIDPDKFNDTLDDIAAGLTDSLPRDGRAPMTGQFKLTDGAVNAPALTFGTALATGVYKTADGIGFCIGGVKIREFLPSGLASPWVDVASAATTDLAATPSECIRVTGTTTITALGTAPSGIRKTLRFADALTLTHNGTSLILTTAANILTAANDVAEFISLGSGNWLMTRYVRASGRALIESSGELVGSLKKWPMSSPPVSHLVRDGSSLPSGDFPELFAVLVRTSAVTITIASPGVITWTAHGLKGHDPVKFIATGNLPTGLSPATTYYVVPASITTNTFQLAATPGGAAINTSGTQFGTHTGVNAPHGVANDLSSFTLPDDRSLFERGWDGGRGLDANRSFGSQQDDELKSHAHGYGDNTANGPNGATGVVQGTNSNNIFRTTDATGGAETRPKNRAYLPIIRFENAA